MVRHSPQEEAVSKMGNVDLAPHQSEVFIGESYVFLTSYEARELAVKVERHLADGYSLFGSPGVRTGGGTSDIYYQAMVKK